MLEWTATTGLPAVLDVLAGLIQKVAEIINEHGPEVQTVLVGIGTTIAALAIGQKVTGFISKLSKLWATLAQFGDLRLLAQKITKEQRRNQISEGR